MKNNPEGRNEGWYSNAEKNMPVEYITNKKDWHFQQSLNENFFLFYLLL